MITHLHGEYGQIGHQFATINEHYRHITLILISDTKDESKDYEREDTVTSGMPTKHGAAKWMINEN